MRRSTGYMAPTCRCRTPPTWKSWHCLSPRTSRRRLKPCFTGADATTRRRAGCSWRAIGGTHQMPIEITMPALSPTMTEGNLAKWLKKEGDEVKSGDVIAEIETDKATMEYEAVDEGTLARIVVPEGTQDVAVNAVIAVLAGEGEDVKAAASAKVEA